MLNLFPKAGPYFAAKSLGVLLFITIFLAMPFTAQPPCNFPIFETGATFGTGGSPYAVAKGDVNNDSNLDIVSANFDGSSVSTLLGNGDGTFQSKVDSVANLRPVALNLADLNHDGKLDAVVLASGSTNRVSILLGNGQGAFVLESEYLIYNPLNVHIADVNSDANLDLIVISGDFVIGKLVVYLGNGSGSFNATLINLPNGASSALAAADFNRDGKLDVVYSTSSGIFVWNGDGLGGFAQSWTWTQNSGDVYAGQFDRDGLIDLAVVDESSRVMRLFTGNGDGTFTRRGNSSLGEVSRKGAVGDINNDGVDDFITSNFASNEISVVVAKGDATFYPTVNYSTSGESRGIAIGDFNRDGKSDVITASAKSIIGYQREDHIKLTLGRGDGTFIAPINYPIFQDSFPNAAAIADLNNDGKDDVVTANSSNWGLSIFIRTGAFRFAVRRDFLQGIYLNNLVVRDFNRDGKADVVGIGGGTVYVLLGDGAGGLTAFGSFPVWPGGGNIFAVSIMVADFDRDDVLDFIVGSRDGGRELSHFRGNGDGTFGVPTLYSEAGDPPLDLAVADFNGDAFPDLAVDFNTGNSIWGRVEIWMNDGSGHFVKGANYNIGVSLHPYSITSGDFNSDGRQDFAVTVDYNAGTPAFIRIYLGNGDGTFSSFTNVNIPGLQPRDIIAQDLNSDGKLDIIVTNDNSEDVSVFQGDGLGSFSVRQRISAGDQAKKMAVGNLNADSSPDIVVVNYNGSTFTIMPNGCNRATEANIRSPFDFDGDGKTDPSVYRPSAGEWWWLKSSNGDTGAVQFGISTDNVASADYTGDGKTDVAFWRPSTGQWFVLRSEDFSFYAFPFGATGDVPVPADYDGDGKADAAVFRESSLTWYISKSSGGTDIVGFGAAGDKPVNADYDGDGKADIAVFRPNGTNGAEWWVRRSSNSTVFATQFGSPTDKAVPADYTGDGKADIAFWTPSNGNWFILRSEDLSYFAFPFGSSTDIPSPGDYDGDGKTDAAVFRPSNSTWYANRSTTGLLIQQFGSTGDVPVPSAYVR